MSAQLDTFKRMLEAFDRGDREAWLAFRHPKSDVLPSATFPEADVVRGPEACWDFYVAVIEPFADARFSAAAEIHDLGRNQILAHHSRDVRGKASGAPVTLDYWVLTTFRDGKVLRDEWFLTEAEARAAAGVD